MSIPVLLYMLKRSSESADFPASDENRYVWIISEEMDLPSDGKLRNIAILYCKVTKYEQKSNSLDNLGTILTICIRNEINLMGLSGFKWTKYEISSTRMQ